jgi:hypothetical protein
MRAITTAHTHLLPARGFNMSAMRMLEKHMFSFSEVKVEEA